MTSEIRTPKSRYQFEWVLKSGQRDEAWDCEVYALHAARALGTDTFTEAQWQSRADALTNSTKPQIQTINERYSVDYWDRLRVLIINHLLQAKGIFWFGFKVIGKINPVVSGLLKNSLAFFNAVTPSGAFQGG